MFCWVMLIDGTLEQFCIFLNSLTDFGLRWTPQVQGCFQWVLQERPPCFLVSWGLDIPHFVRAVIEFLMCFIGLQWCWYMACNSKKYAKSPRSTPSVGALKMSTSDVNFSKIRTISWWIRLVGIAILGWFHHGLHVVVALSGSTVEVREDLLPVGAYITSLLKAST